MTEEERERELLQAFYDKKHSPDERNFFGQFATPYVLTSAIVKDAVSRLCSPRKVLEPACGTGAFISAIKDILPEAQITGIEKNAELSSIARGLWDDKNTHILIGNFFDIVSTLHDFDLLITNPPYTRHHHLTQKEKIQYGELCFSSSGKRLSQLAGLHAYFILAGMAAVKENGIASWLLPAELFSVNYGSVIREYVTSCTTVERLHFFDSKDLQFHDALVSSCVLVVRKKVAQEKDLVEITYGDFNFPEKKIFLTIHQLKHIKKWQHLFRLGESAKTVTIGDFFDVKRGISSGADTFYAKEKSFWHSIGISDEWLIPVLPSPRMIKGEVVEAGRDHWPKDYQRAFLSISPELSEGCLPAAIRKYLSSCPDKIRNGYTARHRKKWYSIERRDPAPIVCTYMSRSNTHPFRFIRNKTVAVVTTSYLCLYPKQYMTMEKIDELCMRLNRISPAELIRSGREYGGGLRKLEPRELLSVPMTSAL